MTLTMTSVEVVETSDTLTNSLFQVFIHPDDHSQTAYDINYSCVQTISALQ